MSSSKSPAGRQAAATFRRHVRRYYREYGRHDLPWRQAEADGDFNAYKILVSEAMLQQTQVARVIPKFTAFLERFPDTPSLAQAPLGEVLRAWNGLGYNRRAKFLHRTARQLVSEYRGAVPPTTAALVSLPGVGPNTAGAILAYAFNRPSLFVETNIRTVYLHHFFAGQTAVSDRAILAALAATMPGHNPRQWYWALMDYGSYLKQTVGNPNRASRSYAKQSSFAGSNRQLRGNIIRLLGERPHTLSELKTALPDERLPGVLQSLQHEGLIQVSGNHISL